MPYDCRKYHKILAQVIENRMTAYRGPEGQERGRVSDSSLRPEGRRGHGGAAATEGSGRTAAEEGRDGRMGRGGTARTRRGKKKETLQSSAARSP